MSITKKMLVVSAVFMLMASVASAATWDVPGDFNSAQEALDNALVQNGDTIQIVESTAVSGATTAARLVFVQPESFKSISLVNTSGGVVTIPWQQEINLTDPVANLATVEGNLPGGVMTLVFDGIDVDGGERFFANINAPDIDLTVRNAEINSTGDAILAIEPVNQTAITLENCNITSGGHAVSVQTAPIADITVTNCHIDGSYQGLTLEPFSTNTADGWQLPPYTVTITDSVIENIQRQGIRCLFQPVDIIIDNSDLLNISSAFETPCVQAELALRSITVTDSTIESGTPAYHVLHFYSPVGDNPQAYASGARGAVNITLERSRIILNREAHIGIVVLQQLHPSLDVAEINQTIKNCFISGTDAHEGYRTCGAEIYNTPDTVVNMILEHNTILNMYHGIEIYQAMDPATGAGSVAIDSLNNIYGTISTMGGNYVTAFTGTSTNDIVVAAIPVEITATGTLTADPMVNADGTLQAGSPAIDAGAASTLTVDCSGIARSDGTNDIGAYEFGSTDVNEWHLY